MKFLWLLAALAALLLFANIGCHEESSDADFTGLNLIAAHQKAWNIKRIEVTGTLTSGSEAFEPGDFTLGEATTSTTTTRADSMVFILPRELANEKVDLALTAFITTSSPAASGKTAVLLQLGRFETATVSLSLLP